MQIIRGLSQIKRYRRPVVALGVFDGLHYAHRRILEYIVKLSRSLGGTSIVITFWPHPQKQKSLYSLEYRLRLISELGIDVCIIIRFNKAFSRILAEDFVKNILVKRIGAHYVCVGRNFRFGKGARGNFKTLIKLSRLYNFKLKIFSVIKRNNLRISSSYIRRLIRHGKLESAQRLLGQPVSVLGTVIKGTALGRKLGFPTANINPHHEVLPPPGVYAAKALFNKKKLKGVCYIGSKPTFRNQASLSVEIYMFNFHRKIYGQNIEIQFLKKIRPEKKFSSSAALVRQIKKDISLARKLLHLH